MTKRTNWIALVVVILIIFLGFKLWGNNLSYSNKLGGEEVNNLTAGQQFELALKEGQPIWLMFGTNKCPYCVQLKKIFDELKPDYAGRITFIEVNLDDKENQELGIKYEIMYVPESYFYDGDGNVSWSQGGLLDKDVIIKELDKIAE